jgi:hypothetical protein
MVTDSRRFDLDQETNDRIARPRLVYRFRLAKGRVNRLGDEKMSRLVGMHRLGGKDVGMPIFQMLGKKIVEPDVAGPEFAMKAFNHVDIFRNIPHHLAAITFLVRIAAQEKGTDEQDLAVGQLLLRQRKKFPVNIPVHGGGRKPERILAAKIAVEIVDPDLDRKPIRLVAKDVVVPAAAQILNGITANAPIDDRYRFSALANREKIRKEPDISSAQRGISRIAAIAIGDAIADEKKGLLVLELNRHGRESV